MILTNPLVAVPFCWASPGSHPHHPYVVPAVDMSPLGWNTPSFHNGNKVNELRSDLTL